MKIDISRDTYRPHHHFTRVLMQQGRVQLDADWNEQGEIMLQHLRSLAADWGGHGWGPGNSFRVVVGPIDADHDYPLYMEPGNYYVAGILCDHGDPPLPWTAPQPKAKAFVGPTGIKHVKPGNGAKAKTAEDIDKAAGFLVVLRVRERVVTALEDAHLRETALGGPDTAARTQVRFAPHFEVAPPGVTADTALYFKAAYKNFRAILDANAGKPELPKGKLAARAYASDNDQPCVIRSENAYRGLENQLYRVEISTPGDFKTAKFVFAPDNASLAAYYKVDGAAVELTGASPEVPSGFTRGDYLELTDDEDEPYDRRGTFHKIKNVAGNVLTLDPDPPASANDHNHLKARCWAAPGEVFVDPENRKDKKGKADDWISLGADGVQVQFDPTGNYEIGDYWLIPARTIGGIVEWPTHEDADKTPRFLPTKRLSMQEAPLAYFEKPAAVNTDRRDDLKPPLLIDLRHSMPAPTLPGPPAQPNLPTTDPSFGTLKAADGTKLAFRLYAAGVASYQAGLPGKKGPLTALVADLLDENGGIVGRHKMVGADATSATLLWEAVDGSSISALAKDTKTANLPDSQQLEWTLDKTTTPATFGLFNNITQVQRLFVVSAPVSTASADMPPAEKNEQTVNFLATFYFYTAPR